ncbi:hypothetical protein D9M70_484040 [compost metagenome]
MGLRSSVVDFDRVTLDDHTQVATREVHVLAVAVRQELDRRAILPGDVYGDDQVPVSDAALMLVRADDELIVATRNAVPKVLAHHPVQVLVFEPLVTFEQGIEPLSLCFVGAPLRDGLSHLRACGRLVRQDVVDGVLRGLGSDRAVHRERRIPAASSHFLADVSRTLADVPQRAVATPEVRSDERRRPAHRAKRRHA